MDLQGLAGSAAGESYLLHVPEDRQLGRGPSTRNLVGSLELDVFVRIVVLCGNVSAYFAYISSRMLLPTTSPGTSLKLELFCPP